MPSTPCPWGDALWFLGGFHLHGKLASMPRLHPSTGGDAVQRRFAQRLQVGGDRSITLTLTFTLTLALALSIYQAPSGTQGRQQARLLG